MAFRSSLGRLRAVTDHVGGSADSKKVACLKIAYICVLKDFLHFRLSRYVKLHLKRHRGISVRNFAMSDTTSVENRDATRYKNLRVSGKTANDHVRMPGKNA